MSMPKRKLGDTGLEVSIVGFGASPLGSVYNDIDDDEAVQAVHEAFRLGINFFDTSPYYGITKSETVLGRCLKGLPRDQIIVATKVGRYGADEFDFSAARVTASVSESLKRLQLDYIDIIQCHDIEFGDLDQVVKETLPALMKLKEQGLVRHIGITGLPLKIFHLLDRLEPGTQVDSILSYCHYTLLDQSLLSLLPYLQQKGVGIINASILSMGLLTNQGPPAWHPAPKEVQESAKQAAEHAAKMGSDISRLAIKDAMQNPDIASHLVGASTPEQVRQNVQTVLQALGLVEDPTAALDAAVLDDVKEILKPVLNVTWPSGLPENN